MANYYGQARSNYFAVKDAGAFLDEMTKYPVEVITKDDNGVTLYGFVDADADGGADIWSFWDEDAYDGVEIDWAEVFKRHLQDDWVAILMESGAEKYRYISGHAFAYNNKGETKVLNLDDIYKLATEIGTNITEATY